MAVQRHGSFTSHAVKQWDTTCCVSRPVHHQWLQTLPVGCNWRSITVTLLLNDNKEKNQWRWSTSVLHPLQPQRTLFHGLWKPFLCTAWHTALLLRRKDGVVWSESEHVQQHRLLYKCVNNKCVKKMQSTKAAVAQFLEWVENNDNPGSNSIFKVSLAKTRNPNCSQWDGLHLAWLQPPIGVRVCEWTMNGFGRIFGEWLHKRKVTKIELKKIIVKSSNANSAN